MKKFFSGLKAYTCMMAFLGVLLVPVCAQASDNAIVVKGTDMTVIEAIRQIEKSTGYTFFYKASDLNAVSSRDIDLKGDIHEVLAAMFQGSGVSYVIKGKEIILTSAKTSKAQGAAPQQTKTITVTGVVSDNFGPVAGATVIEKGNTGNGTVTDLDGKFSLKVQEGATIVVTFIGYTTQEFKAQAGVPLQVSLKEDSQALEEVVVVGFGTQKKANLTGSLTSVNMDELKGDRPIVNVSSALQGAVPGLLVSTSSFEPGQSKSFQLRGAYTLGTGGSGSTIAPLVLIDNVEGDIDMLNPEDIENITVLKDAASTAIYGARAAGGVILVTTKRPHKETAFTLNYNNNFAFSSVVNTPQQAPFTTTLRAYQEAFGDTYWTYTSPSVSKWIQYMDEYKRNPSAFNTVGDGIYVDEDGKMYFLNEHDTYGNFMETGFQQTHNISASGGTDKLRYRISGAFLDSDGVLIGDHDSFRRFNVSSFISADITKWFTQEVTMSYASSTRVKPQSGLGSMFSNEVEYYYNAVKESNPDAIMAPFLSNHDMDRIAGALSTEDKSLQLASSMYLLMPGNPFIYYGEEIGMKGSRGSSNTDANRRLAMLWGDGDTVTDPVGADYDISLQTNGTVKSQLGKADSIYNHYKKLIAIRNANPEIARGSVTASDIFGEDIAVLKFTYNGSTVYVIHNMTGMQLPLNVQALNVSVLRGWTTSESVLEGNTLTIGAFGSVVLK